jgi:hypothetical protein
VVTFGVAGYGQSGSLGGRGSDVESAGVGAGEVGSMRVVSIHLRLVACFR